MRDKRFVASHRGGPLTRKQQQQLIKWAHDCVAHVLLLSAANINERLLDVLAVAKAWENEMATVAEARNASVMAIALANGCSDPVSIAVSRAAGHAVATAHMADHSLRAAEYALKAVKASGQSIEKERKWQDEHIPAEVKELVLSARYNS